MESVIDELKLEVERLAKENELDETAIKILHWFADESIGIEGRIKVAKLKQQVSRLGKRVLDGGDEA